MDDKAAKRQVWRRPPRAARAEPLGPEQGMDPPSSPMGAVRPPRRPVTPGDELRSIQRHLGDLKDEPEGAARC